MTSGSRRPVNVSVDAEVLDKARGMGVNLSRAAEDGKTVRVRGHQGSAELDMKTDGVYEGEGYMLMTKGKDGVSLTHSGAPMGKSCKPA